jgi:hypothetical protein
MARINRMARIFLENIRAIRPIRLIRVKTPYLLFFTFVFEGDFDLGAVQAHLAVLNGHVQL